MHLFRGHDHGHCYADQQHHPHRGHSADRNLWLATGLTLAYAGVEAGVGWWAESLALVADAGHMFNDACNQNP